jgi:hypothetical protein
MVPEADIMPLFDIAGADGNAGGSTPYGYIDASVGDGRSIFWGLCVTARSSHSMDNTNNPRIMKA